MENFLKIYFITQLKLYIEKLKFCKNSMKAKDSYPRNKLCNMVKKFFLTLGMQMEKKWWQQDPL